MYLKHATEVASAARPSRMSCSSGVMFCVDDVNGAAIEASASESESPTAAAFRAPQSLAPSPHMPTTFPRASASSSTSCCFCSGDMRAYTRVWGSSLSNTVGGCVARPPPAATVLSLSSRRTCSSLCFLWSAAQTVPVMAISAPLLFPTPAHSSSDCTIPQLAPAPPFPPPPAGPGGLAWLALERSIGDRSGTCCSSPSSRVTPSGSMALALEAMALERRAFSQMLIISLREIGGMPSGVSSMLQNTTRTSSAQLLENLLPPHPKPDTLSTLPPTSLADTSDAVHLSWWD
mmetsp:Transcript_23606/g.54284  ORF Transcript_23606/g.54284 Transcript_23606/m.54284 type:complete len:290 (+) Transcript_23606:948-1817(+)